MRQISVCDLHWCMGVHRYVSVHLLTLSCMEADSFEAVGG